jgi:chemotaxis protein methyltransferase CheR
MGGRLDGWHIDIHATDLNQNFLTRARDGKFRAWALHSTCEEMKRSCFSKDGLLWTIHPRYKQWISFRHMNLIDGEFQTHFDLVLCRNVMIYFTAEANTRLVGRLHQSIVPGGWLVVGASEHKTENYKLFRSVNAAGAKVYQRIPSTSAGVVFPGVVHPRVTHIAQPIQPAPVANLLPDPRLDPRPDLNGLLQLANRGDWKGAARYGERLLHEDRLNPAAHFYQALIFENLGRADRSERSFRQAIYLDRNFAVAHYHLGLALKRSRQLRAADRCFTNVLRILTGMQADAVVTAGAGVSVTGLRDLAKMHLAKVVNGA